MPFAQWGWPHQNEGKFKSAFPADFISEAIDQTRGWFYSLLMIATLVFDEPEPRPFKTCIVLGHVSDKEGKKESKSKGNYTPPDIILDEVKMDFAVVDVGAVKLPKGAVPPGSGTAAIAFEDFEGMDLKEGQHVRVSRVDDPNAALDLKLVAQKGLPRRVVVVHEADRAKLGVIPTTTKEPKPVDVPWLPREQRVSVRDPQSSSPGADAFRWFFYASSPPWSATRHSLGNVRALQKEFAVKLRNVFSFFTIYASIDGFDPKTGHVRLAVQPELDRWVRSELALTTRDVTSRMDAYDVYGATQRLVSFVDALSNWWVRRSRTRFWRAGWDDDKRSAYETLYGCLVTVAKLIAPFTPYAAEAMYQNLVVGPRVAGACESVHLEEWPVANLAEIDETLSARIDTVRALVSIGLQVRTQAKVRVRQPLSFARIVTGRKDVLDDSCRVQLAEELNTEQLEVVPLEEAGQYVTFRLKPNFRTLGQRGLGKEAQGLKKTLGALESGAASALATKIMSGVTVTIDGVTLGPDDVEVELVAKEGFAAAGDRAGVVVLDTRLDDGLRDRGFVRELQNRVQAIRKEMGLEYTDRIRLELFGGERLQRVARQYAEALGSEVLAIETRVAPAADAGDAKALDIEGEDVRARVTKA
jgi:isoleucyl-tRNA synthetase